MYCPQGRTVDGVAIGRHPLHPVLAPVAPVEVGTPQPQVQPFAFQSPDYGNRATFVPDGRSQISFTSSHGDRAACGSGTRPEAIACTKPRAHLTRGLKTEAGSRLCVDLKARSMARTDLGNRPLGQRTPMMACNQYQRD